MKATKEREFRISIGMMAGLVAMATLLVICGCATKAGKVSFSINAGSRCSGALDAADLTTDMDGGGSPVIDVTPAAKLPTIPTIPTTLPTQQVPKPPNTTADSPTAPASMAEAPALSPDDNVGDQTFLWKPGAGEKPTNDGKVCILLPARYRKVEAVTVNGADETTKMYLPDGEGGEVGPDEVAANGNRMHVRLKKPGKDYGKDVAVEILTGDGDVVTWTVPDGGERWTKDRR